MSEVVIKGGLVVDQTGSRPADVLVGADGRIRSVAAGLDAGVVLDASGCVVAPGLVDLHTHLRQPGREDAETVASGASCGALGGYTALVAMPNTTPAADCTAVISELRALAAGAACEIFPAGAITVDRAGERLAPLAELASVGVRMFTDDGAGVQDELLMRRALEYSTWLGVVLSQHCEVQSLAAGTCMNEGYWSAKLGLPGQPAEAEELMVARDIALARLTGGRVHFQHLSTAGSAELVRRAKAAGLAVTAEVTPHHLTLTEACVATYDPVFKVNPPLRTDSDVAALRAALADGTIDAIATDHAPHPAQEKELPFDQAPPGMLGLETALALVLTELAELPIERVLALMSWQPARIAGVEAAHGGPIEPGRPANICVIDTSATWTVDPQRSASLSRNNPYAGRNLKGRVRHTLLRGRPTVRDGELT